MNKGDASYLSRVQAIGCIVCKLEYFCYTPAEIHHIIEGGKRKGHRFVLPLCVPHHRGNSDGDTHQFVSRHPYKARFETAYGTESELREHITGLLDDY